MMFAFPEMKIRGTAMSPFVLVHIIFFNLAVSGATDQKKLNEIRILPSTHLHATEGESKAADCSLSNQSNARKMEWISPRNEIIESDMNRAIYVEDDSKFVLRLIFTNLTRENSGTYTCRVLFENATPISKEFELQISKKYKYLFEDDEKIYFGVFGNAITLQCRRQRTFDSLGNISWSFNNRQIGPEDEKDFVIMDDEEKLWIKNVSNETVGNYSCTWIVSLTGNVVQREMQLRLASAPKMVPVHTNDTVHVPIVEPAYVAQLACRVDADPPSSLSWSRYDNKLESRDYNIAFEENYSTLQLPITSRTVLGNYLCLAKNSIGTSNVTIQVVAAEMPIAPKVHKREGYENGYRLDIDQSAQQKLSNYRVLYGKKNNVSVVWNQHDFQIRDSKTLPYSINGLEPNQEYIFKVGACTFYDLCTYTEESTFKTTESVTSSGIRVAQLIVLSALLPTLLLISFSTS